MVERDALDAAAARSLVAAADFRASEPYRALQAAFCGNAVEDAAVALLEDTDWVGALIAPLVGALAQDPWFEPPFRIARDGLRIGAVLFENAAISIVATVLSADALAALPPPRTVVVPGRLTLTRYIHAGDARLCLWDAEPMGADFSADTAPPCRAAAPVVLGDGFVMRIDGRTRGHILTGARRDVVTVSATIRAATAPYAREYAIETGALVRIATNDDRAARTQMLLAYLRLAHRSGAAERFAEATHDPAFFLRWGAMREWLAVDTRAALPRLREMAVADPHAEVRAAARATLALVAERMAA